VAAEQLKRRTQAFGVSIIRLIQTFPDRGPEHMIGLQLIRCGTSVGANFRSACRARSNPDFIAKLKIVEEECDESLYWLEILQEIKTDASLFQPLRIEANQILSIIVASIKTARNNSKLRITNDELK
jgi:four helix bundle protein